jgi:hypothetical protein
MIEFLPQDISDGFDEARRRHQSRKSRLRVQLGEEFVPVLQFWKDGFALDGAVTTHLRGLVDIFDGARHEFQCLIVASRVENGNLICDFKRATRVEDRAALDYWQDTSKPAGYLTKA